MINKTNSGLGGRLYCRLRYLKSISRNEKNPDSPQVPENGNPQHSMNDLLWLKTIVVSNANLEEIRTKLKLTRSLRDEMVLRENVELIQEFPFFFTHPLLVNFNEFSYFFRLSFLFRYEFSNYLHNVYFSS